MLHSPHAKPTVREVREERERREGRRREKFGLLMLF
jgi:hypothetical protein